MASSSREPTVAITGLAAGDNPAPAIAIARCLREARAFRGRIVGLTFDHRFTGSYADTLLDDVFLTSAPAYGEQAFLASLAAIRQQVAIDVLIPALDPDVALCAAASRWLAARRIRTLVPPATAIRRRAKTVLESLARGFGFTSPKTVTLTSPAGLPAAVGDLGLPLFLKGSFADAKMVTTLDEAYAEFQRLAAKWGLPLLAQQRVTGDELNLTLLLDGQSRRIGAVAMRKLGVTAMGKGWAGVTVRLPEVVEQAGALLASIGWVGPAELEMIRPHGSTQIHLIEINPRFPAWTYLTAAAGQNLPWAAVRLARGLTVKPFPAADPGTLFTRSVQDHFGPFERVNALTSTKHVALGGR